MNNKTPTATQAKYLRALAFALSKKPNPTLDEVSGILAVTAPAASQMLKRLERKGFIEINGSERRITITETGNTPSGVQPDSTQANRAGSRSGEIVAPNQSH